MDPTNSLTFDELGALCLTALKKHGATDEEATAVYSDYLHAELRGKFSHGFASFEVALAAFPKAGQAVTTIHTDSLLVVEGNGDCGHTVARRAIDEALTHRNDAPAVTIGLRNITRFNTPGPIARYAAERGAVAVVLEYGGKNFMTPYGGTRAALSTNPLAVAFPGSDFLLDMATSERAIGYVSLAKLSGEAIPDTWGVDADGSPTTDPNQLAAVRPFGGYKGYGLALALELLSGALVGVPVGSRGELHRRGALLWLMDPVAFGHTQDSFAAEINAFLTEVINVPPLCTDHPVVYPGQKAEERAGRLLRSGVLELPVTTVMLLRKLSKAPQV